jgi:hypothetical protein
MSEEKEDGMSTIKKTIIGAITTAVTAGGAWFATHLGGGEEPKAETPAAVAAPAPVINITTNNEQKQQANNNGGNTVIIKEKAAPAPAESKPASKPKVDEEDPW